MTAFLTDAVLKRDVFSETQKGHMAGDPGTPVIRRIVSASPLWCRPLAWLLARREIRALRALAGIRGTPRLIETDRHGLLRSWTDGLPLHLARPRDPAWFRDAHRLLRELRRRGVTHNDLAKPQNWLMAPDGSAAVIDFQLASVHGRHGQAFRALAYEDFRHLIKQKRAFAPHLLTPTARRVLARRAPHSKLWRATGKRFYNVATRRLLGWSDGEGTRDRLERDGPRILAALSALPGVRGAALVPFPMPGKGAGLYAFVETDGAPPVVPGTDLVQAVPELPRRADGTVRDDLLQLVALNRTAELDALAEDEGLRATMQAIAAGRLNLSDRRIARMERRG